MTLRTRHLSRLSLLPVLLLLVVLAAGCGSSAKSSSSGSSSGSSSAASGPYGAAGKTSSTAASAATGTATGTPVTITTKHSKLGTILAAGPQRMSVYLFEADTGPSSTCSGACAKVWPPVTGKPTAGGKAAAAKFGTITRADGTTQVTYKGHPLYYYVKDKDASDVYGAGIKSFGAKWYVLMPSGNKIDNA
jgi:predicted lipoprotein with Yx(FWY)xxD motif